VLGAAAGVGCHCGHTPLDHPTRGGPHLPLFGAPGSVRLSMLDIWVFWVAPCEPQWCHLFLVCWVVSGYTCICVSGHMMVFV
jgi:hypothetical protein